jgi:sugar lactone lactonase YvrE
VTELLARPLGVGSFRLGESPVAVGGELVFVDIEGHALHRLDWHGQEVGALTSSTFAQRVCCAVPAAGGGLLLALEARVEHLAGDGDRTVVSTDVPAGVRLNDGACDSHGRFLVGTTGHERESGMGALHRLDGDRLTTLLDGLTLPNGLGWSPDGRRFHLADSMARQILTYEYDPGLGQLGARLATVDLGHLAGYPDGLAVDSEGNLWVAFWDGAAVRCLEPDGTVRHEVRLPVPDPTSCAFLAPGTLVITTARGDGRAAGAGDLFRVDVPASGLPTTPWRP